MLDCFKLADLPLDIRARIIVEREHWLWVGSLQGLGYGRACSHTCKYIHLSARTPERGKSLQDMCKRSCTSAS